MTEVGTPLAGRVALVTGASRGIGRGTAVELGAAGATVYVTARSFDQPGQLPGTVTETAAEVTSAGGLGIPVQCDHADDDQVQAVVDRIADEHGQLDLLVNSVYSTPDIVASNGPELPGGAPFWETPTDSWHTIFTVAVRGHYVMTQKAMPLLLAADGLIVNIASAGASMYMQSVLYGAGKAAGDRMMRDMAFELRNTGVTCLALWPGWVATDLIDAILADGYDLMREYYRLTLSHMPDNDIDIAGVTDEELASFWESPRFTGRAIAALAADASVKAKSGHAFSTVGIAEEYGFTDTDGRIPDGFHFRKTKYWPALG